MSERVAESFIKDLSETIAEYEAQSETDERLASLIDVSKNMVDALCKIRVNLDASDSQSG